MKIYSDSNTVRGQSVMTINVNKALLFILLLSSSLPGIIWEIIFIISLLALLWRCFKWNNYDKFYLLPIILYMGLFAIQILYGGLDSATIVRLYGITKCLCGLCICILFAQKVCYKDISGIVLLYLTIINIGYLYAEYFHSMSEVGGSSFWALGSVNALSGMNIIALPNILKKNNVRPPLKIIYLISLGLLTLSQSGTTLTVSYILLAVEKGYRTLKRYFFVKKIQVKVRYMAYFLCFVFVSIYVFNKQCFDVFLSILDALDNARGNILKDAYYNNWIKFNGFKKLFGGGNNQFYHGMYMNVPHNAIIEIALTYGVFGIMVFVVEIIAIIKSLSIARSNRNFSEIFVTVIIAFIFFMLHPFYTTNFAIKIVMVVSCVNLYFIGERRKA